jgi:hypothetical protein
MERDKDAQGSVISTATHVLHALECAIDSPRKHASNAANSIADHRSVRIRVVYSSTSTLFRDWSGDSVYASMH